MTTPDLLLTDFLLTWCLLLSLHLCVSRVGVWSVGHIAFFVTGQLVVGALQSFTRLGPELSLLLTPVLCILTAYLIAFATKALAADFFIVLSVSVALLATSLSIVIVGPQGVSGVPRLFASVTATWPAVVYALGILVPPCLLQVWIATRFRVSALNRAAGVAKASPEAAASMGIAWFRIRTSMFCFAAAMAGLTGAAAGTVHGSTDPASGGLNLSVLLLAVLVVGGVDSLLGSFIGATLLALLPRILERVLPDVGGSLVSTHLVQLAFACLMLTAVRIRPRGIAES